MTKIDVRVADITTLSVGAIVNAANESLLMGGGVCGAIFVAAGADELQTACDAIGRCATGDAVSTPSFALAGHGVARIVHAVGPIWSGDAATCDELLASAYRRSLAVADDDGVTSIAFPALSTGIFGFPSDRAARIAVRTVSDYCGPIELIVLVAFDDDTAGLLRRAVAELH